MKNLSVDTYHLKSVMLRRSWPIVRKLAMCTERFNTSVSYAYMHVHTMSEDCNGQKLYGMDIQTILFGMVGLE